MKGFLKKLVTRVAKGQGGFTLIEMIVVVGIIAVLAAVIVPNIGKFIGSGEQGAMDAEKESVQTAMNAMMAENSINKGLDVELDSRNAWGSYPTGATGTKVLYGADADSRYLQDSTTVYFYCWDEFGKLADGNPDKASTTC